MYNENFSAPNSLHFLPFPLRIGVQVIDDWASRVARCFDWAHVTGTPQLEWCNCFLFLNFIIWTTGHTILIYHKHSPFISVTFSTGYRLSHIHNKNPFLFFRNYFSFDTTLDHAINVQELKMKRSCHTKPICVVNFIENVPDFHHLTNDTTDEMKRKLFW